MKKRAFGLFAAVLMLFCLLPGVALADDTITLTQDNIGDYMTIDGGSYQLGGDITITGGITIKGDVTIDLNGYTLERNEGSGVVLAVGYYDFYDGKQHYLDANLTLRDSSESGTGTVTGNYKGIGVNNTSSLTLESGTVSSSSSSSIAYAIAAGSGRTVTLKGGTVSAPNGAWAIYISHEDASKSCATLNADGGTVEGPVNNSGGTITQSTGVTTATTFNGAVTNTYGTISGGTFNGAVTNTYGTISGGTFNGAVTNTYGTISGGTFNGAVTNDENGTISGGTFFGAVTNNGTITGGTFYGSIAGSGTASGHTVITAGTGGTAAHSAFHTVRAAAGEGGSLYESVVSLRPGESFTFEFTPNPGYAVADVRVDGKSVGAVESYTFRNLSADRTLEVEFAPVGAAATGTPTAADKNPDTGANDVVGMAAGLAALSLLAAFAANKKR